MYLLSQHAILNPSMIESGLTKMLKNQKIPIIQAIVAAVLFGASTPLSKVLLEEIEPIPLAAFLYIGSGLFALLLLIFQHRKSSPDDVEAELRRSDIPWLTGALLAGGVAAPIVLLFSLLNTPASTASLLLNFECVATTLIAALVFLESIDRRIWFAIALLTLASILLTWNVASEWGVSFGVLGILGACILWGMDNNFTRNISAKNPLAIVAVKGLGAGCFSLILSNVLGNTFPSTNNIISAVLLGGLSYGLSIILFVRSLRDLGSTRTSAYFSTAPFFGAMLSLILFRENIDFRFIVSIVIMIIGIFLLVAEKHQHLHYHQTILHEHRHHHDDLHHIHTQGEISHSSFHSHLHQHDEIEHNHDHAPDLHHRHLHSNHRR